MDGQEISFEDWCKKRRGGPMLPNGAFFFVNAATFLAVVVLGRWLFPQIEAVVPTIMVAIIVMHLVDGCFRDEADERRQWFRWTETAIQRPRDRVKEALGRFPDREKLKEYVESHMWFRQPYCIKPECQHCKDCPLKRMKDTRYRSVANTVVLSEGWAADCRGRPVIEQPKLTICAQCKFAEPHRFDEFFDCGHNLEWTDPTIPFGKNVYEPLFYPVKPICPHFERTDDPERLKDIERRRAEEFAWDEFLSGERKALDLDATYEGVSSERPRDERHDGYVPGHGWFSQTR